MCSWALQRVFKGHSNKPQTSTIRPLYSSVHGFCQGGVQRIPESWNIGIGGAMLGSLMLYLKGIGVIMFQLSGFYCKGLRRRQVLFSFIRLLCGI